MPLKPIFDKAPLTAMTAQPLCAGLVRMENAAMTRLYEQIAATKDPNALEGAFRLACIVTAKPGKEPCASMIRALLASQKEDGSFALSFKESVAVLRAAWALYELEANKILLDYIARWCVYAVAHWDALMADDEVWAYSADLLEMLESLYRMTGKAAVLTLCERVATQTMGWSSVLNTVNAQRPTSKAIDKAELLDGLHKENGSREGYYTHFFRTNHAEALADGARSTMAKGWYSGSATELNASKIGWERLSRHHGAVCGGLTSDELLEGASPAEAVSTAALGAWAEALCAAALGEKAGWAFDALERMAFNAMPACMHSGKLAAFQQVNTLGGAIAEDRCFHAANDHESRAMNRLARGYAALASACVTARTDGASINLYMPGRFAVPVGEGLLVFNISASAAGASIKVHCRQEVRAAVKLRIPTWSRNTDVLINGAETHGEVKDSLITFDRAWHDGDTITLTFDAAVTVCEGYHQGKYVLRGPVLMVLPAGENWQQALVSSYNEDGHTVAVLDPVKEWKTKDGAPADVPVLPETINAPEKVKLVPYAKAAARIALFPGRKQA